ncbi:hypothetical protein BDP27DRAFT_1321996 [Rhodocollybia butyracea]|uniref:Uncharacterized protein n=1 Tax=Rhodocollybia butyracea TaxID=206335 RepID=A0A9P5UA07_9AGAR|nr:hypothetical protein BDP27DRAFT_1321996 [Rhodocollybia butyracea]
MHSSLILVSGFHFAKNIGTRNTKHLSLPTILLPCWLFFLPSSQAWPKHRIASFMNRPSPEWLTSSVSSLANRDRDYSRSQYNTYRRGLS